MTHEHLKKIQNAQKEILFDFDRFCKAHNLTYYMVYGTLLGAIRHKGFIPWDDDIDIAMTREEYEKFRAIQHKLPEKYRVWEVCYSDIDHAGLIRIVTHDQEIGGVQIDIFILDYQNEKFGNNWILKNMCRLLHFAKLSKNEKKILLNHFSKQPAKRLVVHFSKLVRLLVGGNANAERLIYNIRASRIPSSRLLTLEDKVSYPIEFFQNPKVLEFDGQLLFAPSQPEKLLRLMYGDFMKIPPEGHQWIKENQESSNT